MPTAKTYSELEALLKKKIANAMVKEGKFVKEKVQEHIQEDVYNKYNPKVYERTGELEDSVISTDPKIKGDVIEVEVKHDYDKINSYPPNQHYSVVKDYEPKDVSEWIPYLVAKGETYPLWGEDVYTKPRDYIENTKAELRESGEHIQKFIQYLVEEGLHVTDAKIYIK